uniref:Uncharacterized protein n=1 Tax=Oryza meridionalis TaxID=40149 RepID=A0A0E0E3C6_9ORYZ
MATFTERTRPFAALLVVVSAVIIGCSVHVCHCAQEAWMIPTLIFPFPAPAMSYATGLLAAPAQADYNPTTPFRGALCRTVRRRRRHRRRRCRHRRTNRSRLHDELMMTVHAGRPAVMMPLNYICIWLANYVRVR